MIDLNFVAFLLIGILFTGYALLDGFDLGIGALHLLVKSDKERRILLNSIGPVWDGNEVWLVTGGGALFALFPDVYATVFSGFYSAFMLLLFALIFRAVAIEFRSKRDGQSWRRVWDTSFCISSILSSFLLGVVVGNLVWGIPLDVFHEYTGNFLDLFHPYALLVGITTVALFMLHGSLYGVIKTEGELQNKIGKWLRTIVLFFIILYVLTTIATLVFVPHMTTNIKKYPGLIIIPLLNLIAIANIPWEIKKKHHFKAFLWSSLSMICLLTLFGIGMYPYMTYSNLFPENSLTLYNAASSRSTLQYVLIIAAIGFPLVLSYTVYIYWIFRGKVKLESTSY